MNKKNKFIIVYVICSSVLTLTFFNATTTNSNKAEYDLIRNKWNSVPQRCSPQSGPIIFGEMKGIKTLKEHIKPSLEKAIELSGKNLVGDSHPAVYTEIQPALYNMSMYSFYKRLIDDGVNTAEIRIDTRDLYGRMLKDGDEQISRSEWLKYIWSLFAVNKNDTQTARIEAIRELIVGNQFTRTQQTMAIIEYLKHFNKSGLPEVVYNNQLVSKNFKFMLAELAWFGNPSGAAFNRSKLDLLIEEYSTKMSFIINAAQHECVDHLLAGVFYFEPATTNIRELLYVQTQMAAKINLKTHGWLKRQGALLFSGGGWGADYVGLQNLINNGSDKDFFKTMQSHTGSYAIAYKAMQFNTKGYLNGDMVQKICAAENLSEQICTCAPADVGCRSKLKSTLPVNHFTNDPVKWKKYYELIGFSELKNFINTNRALYPRHANVVYVGDSADALMDFTQDANPVNDPVMGASITALADLFKAAGLEYNNPNSPLRISDSWKGKSFMRAYHSIEPATDKKPSRIGLSFNHIEGYSFSLEVPFSGTVTVEKNDSAYDAWNKWPRLP
jgi:hypothetical protein